jgi:PqqD family protein of HPr-rel-A system
MNPENLPSLVKWKIAADVYLHFTEWDNEFLVYDEFSGNTHLLNSTAAHILFKLKQQPLDAVALAELLFTADQPATDAATLVSQTTHILSELHAIALIEPT